MQGYPESPNKIPLCSPKRTTSFIKYKLIIIVLMLSIYIYFLYQMTTGSHFFKLYFLPLSNCRQREDSRQILLSWTLPGQLAQTLVNLNLASQTIYSKIKFNPNYIRGPTCCWFIAYYNTTKLINCRDVGMGVEYIFQFFSSKFLQAFNVIWNTEKEKNNKKKTDLYI